MRNGVYNFGTRIQTYWEDEVDVLDVWMHNLIVWNDNVNSFDAVREALVNVCDHTPQQAEQCTMIIHNKGQYAVKNGSFKFLKPLADALLERNIHATIDG